MAAEDGRGTAGSSGRILRDLRVLVSGRAAFALVNLAAVAVATRAVGIEALGAVGLLVAYARLIGDVAKFNSWQAFVVFGAAARAEGDLAKLRRLGGLTLLLDIGACLAALAAAWAGARLLGAWLGWTAAMIDAAPWFSLLLVFVTHMTPAGILRLEGRMVEIAGQHAVTAVLRLAGALLLLAFGGGFLELAVVWLVSAGVAALLLWRAAWRAARAGGWAPDLRAALREGAAGFDGFGRYALAGNLSGTLNGLLMPAATLATGALLGPFEAGLFHLVRQIAEAVTRGAEMLAQVVFPEFARLAAAEARAKIRRLVGRTLLFAGVAPLVLTPPLFLWGADLLGLLFGAEARPAGTALALSGLAAAIQVAGFALEPALLALGRPGAALRALALALLLFAALLAPFAELWGLAGVAGALVAARAAQTALRLLALRGGFGAAA